jgi:hypothetical protein
MFTNETIFFNYNQYTYFFTQRLILISGEVDIFFSGFPVLPNFLFFIKKNFKKSLKADFVLIVIKKNGLIGKHYKIFYLFCKKLIKKIKTV